MRAATRGQEDMERQRLSVASMRPMVRREGRGAFEGPKRGFSSSVESSVECRAGMGEDAFRVK